MPAGLLVTVPSPVPDFHTVSLWVGDAERTKMASTARGSITVTWQVEPVPVQAPLHPRKTDSLAAVAVSVTTVPLSYAAEHAPPHSIPSGALVTVPVPVPVLVTVRV